ncbi:MAG: glycoside hydrolase [Actinobacteria bacterium]|nr:glycoside hydrolase [Actinomycetota bacterium]
MPTLSFGFREHGIGVVVALTLALGLPTTAVAASKPQVEIDQNLPVTAMDGRTDNAHNSPVLAADPTEPRFVALASRLDSPDFGCALHLSGDGGRYWVPAEPVPQLPPGADKCYAPELVFDRKGTLYYLFVGLQGTGNSPMGAFLVTSSDRGRSFSSPRPIIGPNNTPILGPYNYMVRMAIDPDHGGRGRIHLGWLHAVAPPATGGLPAQGNPILASYSDDGGNTFSEPVQVSDPKRQRAVAPALAVGADNAVHLAYYDLQDDAVDYQGLEGPTWGGTWSLVVATSYDGGKHFERGVVVEERVVPPGRVMLIFTMPPPALAARGKYVYTAWPDARHGDPDIFLARSANGARSWKRVQRLNDDPIGTGAHQSLVRLSVAPNGRLDAVFYDRRDDVRNILSQVYYTFSSDRGQGFSSNIKITSRPSYTGTGPTYESIPSAKGLIEFGSRLGLLSGGSSAVAAWTDTRNEVGRRQDIFSVRLAIPSGRRAVPALPLAGIGVVVGFLGAIACRARRNRVTEGPKSDAQVAVSPPVSGLERRRHLSLRRPGRRAGRA